MDEKRGRKRKNDAKITKLQVRIDNEETDKLRKICEDLDLNTSEAVRYAIDRLYDYCASFDAE